MRCPITAGAGVCVGLRNSGQDCAGLQRCALRCKAMHGSATDWDLLTLPRQSVADLFQVSNKATVARTPGAETFKLTGGSEDTFQGLNADAIIVDCDLEHSHPAGQNQAGDPVCDFLTNNRARLHKALVLQVCPGCLSIDIPSPLITLM